MREAKMDSLPFQYQKREFWEFFCPICKAERRSFYWPSPRRRHYIQLFIFSLCLAICLWPFIGLKGLFAGLPVWAIFEFVYRAKARQSLVCPHCGFDPYLYKYDVKLARDKVKKFFDEKEARKKKDKGPSADSSNSSGASKP